MECRLQADRVADVVVDLGKTRCRALVASSASSTPHLASGNGPRKPAHTVEVAGAPGLSTPRGVADATASIRAALSALPELDRQSLRRIAVGAAGALTAPPAAAELADRLAELSGASEVIVTSDAITAHIGALGGGPGVVISAGTGAVAVSVDAAGDVQLADGVGPETGDFGSGGWIGGQALQAAIDGSAALTMLAEARFGTAWRQLAQDVSFPAAQRRGSFVPDVASLARQGDSVALDLLDRAAGELACTAIVAVCGHSGTVIHRADCAHLTTDGREVAVVGGLTKLGPMLLAPLASALAPMQLRSPAGTPLDGAALLLTRHDLPHESRVHRVAQG